MKLRSLVLGAAACVALSGVASPSEAAPRLYLYAEPNYAGQIGWRETEGWWNMTADNNDTLSSYKNQTGYSTAFWHDANRAGKCWSASGRTDDPSFHWLDDNKVTSYALGQGC